MNPRKVNGFTLLEILVVMTLMSFMMLALMNVAKSIEQIKTRINSRLSHADDQRTTVDFLSSVLERMIIVPSEVGADSKNISKYYFESSELKWIGIMPARYGIGGGYHFNLKFNKIDNDGNYLTITANPIFNDGLNSLESGNIQINLISNVSDLKFKYQDNLFGRGLWRDDWPLKDRLPSAISMQIEVNHKLWPEIIVRVNGISNKIGG